MQQPKPNQAFRWGILLNSIYIIAEATFGLLIGSIALLADAAHNLSDVLGLGIAWFADWLSCKRPTANRTYGYKGSSILAALINAVFLLVAMGAINLDELLEYRHINDRSCARLAAIHHTEEDAEALRQTLEGAKANLDSLFSFQEYDVAFHSALAKASHNTLASLINDVIVRLNTDVFVETIRDYTPEQLREINLRIYNTHYAIMEAVLAHDPDGADRAVAAMVRLFQDTVH